MVLAHLFVLFNRARGIDTENCGTMCFFLMTPGAKCNCFTLSYVISILMHLNCCTCSSKRNQTSHYMVWKPSLYYLILNPILVCLTLCLFGYYTIKVHTYVRLWCINNKYIYDLWHDNCYIPSQSLRDWHGRVFCSRVEYNISLLANITYRCVSALIYYYFLLPFPVYLFATFQLSWKHICLIV